MQVSRPALGLEVIVRDLAPHQNACQIDTQSRLLKKGSALPMWQSSIRSRLPVLVEALDLIAQPIAFCPLCIWGRSPTCCSLGPKN